MSRKSLKRRRLLAERLEDRRVLAAGIDYGDAPDLDPGSATADYQTTLLDGGPSHTIVHNLFLGNRVDGDDGALQATNAKADDDSKLLADLAADFVAGTMPGESISPTATGGGTWSYLTSDRFNPSDANANLKSMVWDTTGNFFEAVDLGSHSDGFNGVYLGYPGNGEIYTHPRRFTPNTVARWTAGPDDAGQITINGRVGKGDTTGGDGVRFAIYVDGQVKFDQSIPYNDGPGTYFNLQDLAVDVGSTVDFVVNSNPSSNEYDTTRYGATISLADDEDGLQTDLRDLHLFPGNTTSIVLNATNLTGIDATLAGWIDYNGDGVFDNVAERATAIVPSGSDDAAITLVLPEAPDDTVFSTYARFRLSNDADFVADPQPIGSAVGGEVEDYLIGSYTRIWDGEAGDNNWFNPTNWATLRTDGTIVNSNVVPRSFENVWITEEFADQTIIVSTTSSLRNDINSIRSAAPLLIAERGRIQLSQDSRLAGLTIDGTSNGYGAVVESNRSGGSKLVIDGDLVWHGQTVYNLAVTVGGDLKLLTDQSKSLSAGSITVYGIESVWSGGDVSINGSAIVNHGTFTMTSNADFLPPGPFSPTGTFVNAVGATLIHNAPLIENEFKDFQGSLRNQGDFQVRSGEIEVGRFGGTVTHNGSFHVAADAGLRFTGNSRPTFSLTSSILTEKDSRLTISTDSGTIQGAFDISGDLTIDGSMSFVNEVSVPTLVFEGNDVAIAKTLTVADHFDFRRGTLTGPGNFVSQGTSTLGGGTIPGGITLRARLINEGDAQWVARDMAFQGGVVENRGTFLDASAGTMQIGVFSSASVQNFGTWTVADEIGAGVTANRIADFTNHGEFILGGSDVMYRSFHQNAGTVTINGGAFNTQSEELKVNGGTFRGSGSIRTGVTLGGGVIAPGMDIGSLSIDGRLLTTSGEIDIDIIGRPTDGSGADAAGVHFDQLVVGGLYTVAGTLDLHVKEDFTPVLGDVYEIIRADSRSSTFSLVSGTRIRSGLQWDVSYTPTSVLLTVVEGPEETLAEQFNAGLAKLQTQFPLFGTLFDLAGVELPVIGESLDTMFGISGASGLLGRNADDFLTVDPALNTATAIRDAIDARDGYRVVCVDGANECDPNDILLVEYSQTIEGLQSLADFDDDTLSLLTDLAAAANLDGSLDYDADLSIDLKFGLDGVGFFFSPDSHLTLSVAANGGLSSAYDLTDSLSVTAGGSATASIDVSLTPGPGASRLRPDDLDDFANTLTIDASGTSSVTLDQTLQPLNLGWGATWSMDVIGGVTSTSASVAFPDQDKLLATLIPWIRDELGTALDSQIGNIFESFDLPLVDESLGPRKSASGSGTSAESDFQFPLFVQELLRDLPNLLNSGVEVGDDGELQRLGTGLFYTEGDEILNTHLLRDLDTYALSGKGIKIGVISDGIYGLRGAQKGINAEISPRDVDGTINGTVHVHPTYSGGPIGRSGNGAGAEGTAMIEIIHDIAPQAEIYFAGVGDRISKDSNGIWRRTNINREKAFLAGLKWFVENEVNIIVDDISLFDEPFFDDGKSGRNPFQGNIAYEVRKLIESSTNDILFVSSAGNRNGDHYQAPAKMKRVTDGELGDGLYHLFDEFAVPHAERRRMKITIPPGERLNLALQWDQTYEHPASNFTLALFDAVTGKRIRRSRDVDFPSRKADRYVTFKNTRKAKDPSDPVQVANASREVYVVIKLEGSLDESDPFAPVDPPMLELFAWGLSDDAFGKLNVPGDAIFGHAAVNGVLTVGAFDQADSQTGYPETFSSVGPSTVSPLFGFEVRDSLDVVGPDNVQISGRYKFGNLVNGKRFFTGTSAAAPHLAGLAALLMQLNRDTTSQQIVTAIQQTARDVTAAPIAVPDRWYVEGLSGINVIDVLANDIDVDAVFGGLDSRMGLKLIDAKLNDTTLDAVVVVANNYIAYEAPTTGRNTNSVGIEYTIEDHEGNRAKGTLTVLHGLGDAPLAVNDGVVTLVGQSVEIPVLANDQQREGLSLMLYDNDILSANGGIVTFTPDGTLVYEPPSGFTGIDTFQYAVASQGAVDFGTVTVRVIASAIDFVAEQQDDIVIAKRGDHVAVNVVGNDFVLGDVNISSVTCNGITCANFGFEEVQNVSFSGGVITFDVNPLETPVSETNVEIEYQIDTPGIITTGKLTVLIENYSTVISGADATIVSSDDATDIEVLLNDRLQIAGEFQSVATATGATITDVFVSNLSESSALLESMISITDDGQAIRFNPNADFDRIAAVGSHNDMSVELDESEFTRLGPVEYTAVTPSGHEFQGYLYLLAARSTGLRPATSVDPTAPNNTFSKELAGYDQRSGYGIPDALEAAFKLIDQNSDEEEDPIHAAPPPSLLNEASAQAAAPTDNPFALSYTDLLTDLGFTVNSLISTAQIADLLAGRGLVGDLISLTYATDSDDEAIYSADYDVDLSEFGALGAALTEGDMELDLRPNVTLGFGLDAAGFFLLPQSTIAGEISGTANVGGEFMGLSASAVGAVVSDAALSLAPLDGDSDGKIRIGEVLPNLGSLNLQVSGIAADLSIELSSELLDYVDVDGIIDNNTVGGGDAFRFTASTGLTASLPDGSGGFDFTWTGIQLQNGEGNDGFTSHVLGENLRLLARDVIRGERTLFNDKLLAAFGLESLPLVNQSLAGGTVADGLEVAKALATAALDATVIVYTVPFSDDVEPTGINPNDHPENNTVEEWLNFGLPSQTQELVRLKLDLGQLALGVSDSLVFDLSRLLPDTANFDGLAGIENAVLTGDLVFGFDTSSNPFYLLTSDDNLTPGVSTTFEGKFDVLVNISGQPIGGGLATFQNAQASISPTIQVSFAGDGVGKYRLGDDLSTLAAITIGIDNADVMNLSADLVSFTPGPVTLTGKDDGVDDDIAGISGQFNLSTGEILVTTRRVEGSIDGLLQIEADALSGPALTFHRNPSASPRDTLLSVDGLHGTIDALTLNEVTPEFQIPQFEILHDGTIVLPRAIASFQSGFADYVGLAGILPFDLSQLTIDFNDPSNLGDFTVGVDGAFDFSSFNLPFDATVTIDGDVKNQFHADINADSIRVGDIRPVNVGPVTVGLSNFTIPGTGVAMAGQLQIGRIDANGVPQLLPGFDDQVRGFLEVTSGDATYPLGLRIDLAGTLDLFKGGASLDVDGTAMLSTGGGDAAARFKFGIDAFRTENGPLYFDVQVDAQLLEVTLTDLDWDLSPVATIHVGQVQFLPTPGPNGEVANLIDLEVRVLPDGDDEFATFTVASAAGFDETSDGTVSIDAFSIENASVFFNALSLEGFLDLDDLMISIPSLSNRGGTLIGSIELRALGIDILPGHGEFNASGELLAGAFDLQTGALELSAARAEVNVGSSLQLVTNDITIHWDPSDQSPVLAEIGGASLLFPAYPSFPTTDINGLTIRRDGFSLDSFLIESDRSGPPDLPAGAPPVDQQSGNPLNPEIHGRVWVDSNQNGTRVTVNQSSTDDEGEAGAPGVTVQLFAATDLLTPIDSVLTDGNGQYTFENVPAGDYHVRVLAPVGLPTFYFVPKDQGGFDDYDSDVDISGYTDVITSGGVTGSDIINKSDAGIRWMIERPVIIMPGIMGSYARDIENDSELIFRRGVHPDKLTIDPLLHVYDDLIKTLENSGFQQGKDLFVANYDWRNLPAPIDGVIDGVIQLSSATSLTDDVFEYGVDYLGYWLEQASNAWFAKYGVRPEKVDVIVHSTGGIVARSYIQSNVYGGTVNKMVDGEQVTYQLPKVADLVMLGVPNRGASKAWNVLQDNWVTDVSFQLVISKLAQRAYSKLIASRDDDATCPADPNDPGRCIVLGGNDAISTDDITYAGILGENGQPDPIKFINQYVPTIRSLLSTYDFLKPRIVDGEPSKWTTPINQLPNVRNSSILDLNAGLDLLPDVGIRDYETINRFARQIDNLVVIAGISEATPTRVQERKGELENSSLFGELGDWIFGDIAPLSGGLIEGFFANEPGDQEVWFEDLVAQRGGDETVPSISSIKQFMFDPKVDLVTLARGDQYVNKAPAHTELPSLLASQRKMLEVLGINPDQTSISQQLSTRRDYGNLFAVVIDPVGGMVLDQDGNPLVGYDAGTGTVIESPGTMYLGAEDGIAYLFGDHGDLSLQFTGLPGGGDYFVQTFARGPGIAANQEFRGTLAENEVTSNNFSITEFFSGRSGIPNIVEFEGLTIGGTGISVLLNPDSTVSIAGTLTLDVQQAVLLPDVSTPELDGLVDVDVLHGSIDLQTGIVHLSADNATVTVPDIVTISALPEIVDQVSLPGLEIKLDPTDSSPSATIATIRNLSLELPSLPNVPFDLLEIDITVRRNGFDVKADIDGQGRTIDVGSNPVLLTVHDLSLDADLHVTFGDSEDSLLPSVQLGGHLRVDATSGTLLPGSPLTASVLDDTPNDDRPGLWGEIDLDDQSLSIFVDRLIGGYEGLFGINADDGELHLSPNRSPDDPLLSVDQAEVTLSLIDSADIHLVASDIIAYSNGDVTFTQASVESADGIGTSLGLAGLLPVDLTRVSIAAVDQSGAEGPDPILLNTLTSEDANGNPLPIDIEVEGFFNFDGLNALPFVPTASLGGGPDNTFDVTFRKVGGSIVPWNTGDISLGLSEAEIFPGFKLGGSLTLGGYVDGIWQTDVGGSLKAAIDIDNTLQMNLAVLIDSGSYLDINAGTLFVAGTVMLDTALSTPIGGFAAAGLELPFTLLLDVDPTASVPYFEVARFEVSFGDLNVDEVVIEVGGIMTLTARDLSFDTSGSDPDLIATIGEIELDIAALSGLEQTSFIATNAQLFNDRLLINSAELLISGTVEIGEVDLLAVKDLAVTFTNVGINFGGANPLTGSPIKISDVSGFIGGIDVHVGAGVLMPEIDASLIDYAAIATAGSDIPGLAAVVGLDGFFAADGTLTIDVDRLGADLFGLLEFEAIDGTLHLGPDLSPDDTVFSIATATLSLPLFDDNRIELTANDLNVTVGGTVSITSASASVSNGLASAVGLGDILPFDLTAIHIDPVDDDGDMIPDPISLNIVTGGTSIDDLDIRVEGEFDMNALSALPFTPVIAIGDQRASDDPTFDFTFRLLDLDTAAPSIRILDTGAIKFGLEDYQTGPFSIDRAVITLGGFVGGQWVHQYTPDVALSWKGGGVDLIFAATAHADLQFSDPVDVGGSTHTVTSIVLDTTIQTSLATGNLRLDDDNQLVSRDDSAWGFGFENLGIEFGIQFGLLFDSASGFSLQPVALGQPYLRVDGAGVDQVVADLGGIVRLSVENVNVDFTAFDNTDPNSPVPFLTFGGTRPSRPVPTENDPYPEVLVDPGDGAISLEFGDADSSDNPLAGLGGTAGNFGIAWDPLSPGDSLRIPFQLVQLPDFFVSVSVPDDFTFGFPDWLPLKISEIGLRFPQTFGDLVPTGDLDSGDPGQLSGFALDALTNVSVIFSGGMESRENGWPIRGLVENLEVDLSALTGCADHLWDRYQDGAYDDQAHTLVRQAFESQNRAGALAAITALGAEFLSEIGDGACRFPIIDLDAIDIGVEPFKIGPIEIGGGLGFGILDVDTDGDGNDDSTTLFGRVEGQIAYSDIGIGVELIVTQYGPVLARLFAGVPIPIGTLVGAIAGSIVPGLGTGVGASLGTQSGFILTGFQGGLVFDGKPLPVVQNTLDLLEDPDIRFPLDISLDDIRDAAAIAIRGNVPTWNNGFKFAASGTLTNIHIHGTIGLEVTLGANVGFDLEQLSYVGSELVGDVVQGEFQAGVDTATELFEDGPPLAFQLYGFGALKVLGQSVADAGVMLNFSDPLNPILDIAAKLPAAGGLLATLFPIDGSLAIRLDSKGIVEGSVVAMNTLINKIVGGGSQLFDGILEDIAADLDENRDQILAQLLVGTPDPGTTIDGSLLKQGLQSILADGVAALTGGGNSNDISNAIFAATELMQHLSTAMPASVQVVRDLARRYRENEQQVVDAIDAVANDLQNSAAGRDSALAKILLNTDLTRIELPLFGYRQGLSPTEQSQTIDGTFLVDRFDGLISDLKSSDTANPWIDLGLITLVADQLIERIDAIDGALIPQDPNPLEEHALFGPLLAQADRQVRSFAASAGFDTAALDSLDPFLDPALLDVAKTLASTRATIRQQMDIALAIGEIFVDASGDAFDDFFDVIDPSLTINGQIQPVLLGMPIGEPTEQIEVRINKHELFFEGKFKVLEKVLAVSPIPIPLTDEIDASVVVPFNNLFGDIFTQGYPSINVSRDWRATFRGTLKAFGLFDLGDVTGLIFPAIDDGAPIPADHPLSTHVQVVPQNTDLSTVAREKNCFGPTPDPCVNPTQQVDKVIVLENELQTLRHNGGILLDARLTVPEFISDPIAWFTTLQQQAFDVVVQGADTVFVDEDGEPITACTNVVGPQTALNCFLANPTGFIEYFTDVADFVSGLQDDILAERQIAQVQVFIPNFIDELVTTIDTTDPTGLLNTLREFLLGNRTLADVADEINLDPFLDTLLHDTYFRGQLGSVPGGGPFPTTGKILGFDLGGALVEYADPDPDPDDLDDHQRVFRVVPNFEGLQGSFVFAGLDSTFDPDNAPAFPKIGGQISVGNQAGADPKAGLVDAFASLGFPFGLADWLPGGSGSSLNSVAGATIEAYTPGYSNNASAPLIQRNGGVAIRDANFRLTDFVDVGFDFEISPSVTGNPIPDFVAAGAIDQLLLPGLEIDASKHPLSLELRHENDLLTATLDGSFELFGFEFELPQPVSGSLETVGNASPLAGLPAVQQNNFQLHGNGFSGAIDLAVDDFGVPGVFAVDGSFQLQFDTRTHFASIAVQGAGTLAGIPVAEIIGSFDSKGCFQLTAPLDLELELPGGQCDVVASKPTVFVGIESAVSIPEGTSQSQNTTKVSVTVNAGFVNGNPQTSFKVQVPWSFVPITGSFDGDDYPGLPSDNVLTFEEGTLQRTITIEINQDDDYEVPEEFLLRLGAAEILSGTIDLNVGNRESVVRVLNDDDPDVLTFGPLPQTVVWFDFDKPVVIDGLRQDPEYTNQATEYSGNPNAINFFRSEITNPNGNSPKGAAGTPVAIDQPNVVVTTTLSSAVEFPVFDPGELQRPYLEFEIDTIEHSWMIKGFQFYGFKRGGSQDWELRWSLDDFADPIYTSAQSNVVTDIPTADGREWSVHRTPFDILDKNLGQVSHQGYRAVSDPVTFRLVDVSGDVGIPWIIDNLSISGVYGRESTMIMGDLIPDPEINDKLPYDEIIVRGDGTVWIVVRDPGNIDPQRDAILQLDVLGSDPLGTEVVLGDSRPGPSPSGPYATQINIDGGARTVDLSGISPYRGDVAVIGDVKVVNVGSWDDGRLTAETVGKVASVADKLRGTGGDVGVQIDVDSIDSVSSQGGNITSTITTRDVNHDDLTVVARSQGGRGGRIDSPNSFHIAGGINSITANEINLRVIAGGRIESIIAVDDGPDRPSVLQGDLTAHSFGVIEADENGTANFTVTATATAEELGGFPAFDEIRVPEGSVPTINLQPGVLPGRIVIINDSDGDGVSDATEDDAPNQGDGNHDGIPDRDQGNVTSFPNLDRNRSLTVVVPNEYRLYVPIRWDDLQEDTPADTLFSENFFTLYVTPAAGGSLDQSVNVKWLLDGSDDLTSLFLVEQNPLGYVANVESFRKNPATGTGLQALARDEVTALFKDGQPGDADGARDSRIVIFGGFGLAKGVPAINPVDRFDVNNDSTTSPLDALIVINSLAVLAQSGAEVSAGSSRFLDVSDNGSVSPLDALLVINELARQQSSAMGMAEDNRNPSGALADAVFHELGANDIGFEPDGAGPPEVSSYPSSENNFTISDLVFSAETNEDDDDCWKEALNLVAKLGEPTLF